MTRHAAEPTPPVTAAASDTEDATYRAIFDNINDAIAVHDLDTPTILNVNRAMCELFGYDREELCRLSVADIAANKDGAYGRAATAIRLAATDGPQVFEWLGVTRDGREIWLEVNLKLANLGGHDRVISVIRDITERRLAAQALRASESRYREVVNDLPDRVWRYEPDTTITTANYAFAASLGRSMGEVIGRRLVDLLPPEERDEFLTDLAALTPEAPIRTVERETAGRRGARRWMRRRDRAIVDAGGEIVGYQSIEHDLTEHQQSLAALRDSEERLRAIAEHSPDYIMLLDLDGRIGFINRTVPGLTREGVIGHRIFEYIDEQYHARVRACLKRVRETGRPDEYEVEYDSPHGPLIFQSRVGPIMHDGQVVAFSINSSDVTEWQRTQDALRRQAHTERMLLRELDHRVRNNLSALVTLIDLTRRVAPDTDAFADAIGGRVHAMATVHSLLSGANWARIELSKLIDALVTQAFPSVVEHEGPPVMVPPYQASPLAMVLHELLVNSVKYGALGSPEGRVRLTWTSKPQPDDGVKVTMSWREDGGPPVLGEPRPGVGTSLIEGLVRTDLRGSVSLRYPRAGAAHDIVVNFASASAAIGGRPTSEAGSGAGAEAGAGCTAGGVQ